MRIFGENFDGNVASGVVLVAAASGIHAAFTNFAADLVKSNAGGRDHRVEGEVISLFRLTEGALLHWGWNDPPRQSK